MNNRTITRLSLFAAATVLTLSAAGCSSPAAAPSESPTAPEELAADHVTVVDGWVKAAEEGMTGAFGQLTNDGDTEVTLVSVSSESAMAIELHETVPNGSGGMVMQERDGGFVIPAGGSHVLEPGGDHIMLMGITGPLIAGTEVTFTLTFDDGSTYDFSAPVKDFAGANESYVDDMDMSHDDGASDR